MSVGDPLPDVASPDVVTVQVVNPPGLAGLVFLPWAVARADFERLYIEQLWEAAEHRVGRAAELADVSRQAMYQMLERNGLRTKGEP